MISLFFIPKITDALLILEKESKRTQPNKILINEQITFVKTELPAIIQLILNNLKIM